MRALTLAPAVVHSARARTRTTCKAKKSAITPMVVSKGGKPSASTAPETPTPLTEAKANSLTPEMLKDDQWESENYESIGNAAQYALLVIGLVSAVAGFIATSTYNEGAVEVDFQSYSSPEEAVASSIRATNALASAPSVN